MQNIITQLETSHLESKQNSYKQLNPKFEPMLKVKVFPFYMQVLQKILKKKERKKERWYNSLNAPSPYGYV
jgi:hypothetical protein